MKTDNKYFQAETLMSRKPRTIIPLDSSSLQPQNINIHKYNNSLECIQKKI